MNDFDRMIEEYSRQLIETKRKSILSEIEDGEISPVVSEEAEPEPYQAVSAAEVFEPLAEEVFEPSEKEASEKASSEETDNAVPVSAMPSNAEVGGGVDPRDENYPISGTGKLRVQVYAADQSYPIGSALVTVTSVRDGKEFFRGYTDTSGIVDNVILPTVSKDMSASPSYLKPYEQYNVTVDHPRFIPRKYLGVPVFEGQTSIQTVQLVPTDKSEQKPDVVIESEPNELLRRREED